MTKPNEFAAPPEQVLPGAAFGTLLDTEHREVRTPRLDNESAPALSGAAELLPRNGAVLERQGVAEEPALTGQRLMLDRLEQSILAEVRVTRHLKPDSMAVVLRPDSQTEILVQLTLREGSVHVHARCDRGDVGWIEHQWSGLQERLEERGVRLDPLEVRHIGFASGSDFGGSQRRSSHPQEPLVANREPAPGSAPAPQHPGPAPRPATTRRAPRLLESWA